ncbi:unnamed protein product [Absidia cylindrospora]
MIPQDLWQPLFMKLGEDYLNAGSVMELHQGDPLPGLSLHLKQDVGNLEKHSDIFLIDHAWTTTPETAKQQLRENPTTLLERLENLMGIEAEEGWVDDEEDDDIEHDDELISMVAEQANVSYEKAKQALIDENYEVVNAIANLTIDPEFQKQADALQDQVLGQLIASGKAQEKEDTMNKEKEEKKQQWIKDWMNRRVNNVYDTMWSFIQTYSYTVLKTDGQSAAQIALYVNDEVGSAVSHSSQPNMVCVPFIFSRGASGMIPYSILFPIQTIQPGELITCDLIPKTLVRDTDRQAYLFAFQNRLAPTEQHNHDEQKAALQNTFKALVATSDNDKTINDDVTITNQEKYRNALLTSAASSKTVKVYTDVDSIRSGVILPNIQWVNEQVQADITWTKAAAESSSLHTSLTYQQNLAQLIRRAYGCTASAPWFLPSYRLSNELAECVGDALEQTSSSSGEPVLWTAQSYDTSEQPSQRRRIITTLPELIRQYDTPMTPQLVQHYPANPCLYNGKKFHLRYMVLLNQYSPSSSDAWFAGVYNKAFWVRLANKKFNMEDVQDMDRQLLVGNDAGYEMTALDHTSFIRHMEKEHTPLQWNDIQGKINEVIKGILHAASTQSVATENKASSTSFGVFTFDFMLTAAFQPVVMDIQSTTNPSTICKDDKQIIDNLLSVMDSRFDALDKGLETFTLL